MRPEILAMSLALAHPAPAPPPPAAAELPAEPAPAEEPESPRWMALASAEDRARWGAGEEIGTRIAVERTRSNRIQWDIRKKEILARLTALARQADARGATRAAAVLPRLRHELQENHQAMVRPWRVDPTRGCRNEMLGLQGVLSAEGAQRRPSHLAVVREDLDECLQRARPMIRALSETNRDLELLLSEAEAILPPLPRAVPRAAAAEKP